MSTLINSNNQSQINNTDMKIYNEQGEHIGFIDVFPDIDKSTILDPDNQNKLNIFTYTSKKLKVERFG